MNQNELHRKLIAAARAHPPSAAVPFKFERRITALIGELAIVDSWGLWAHALWRAAAPCVAITLLLAAWSLFVAPGKSASNDLSQDLENTVMAAADVDQLPAETLR
jgi:hypothetical protein